MRTVAQPRPRRIAVGAQQTAFEAQHLPHQGQQFTRGPDLARQGAVEATENGLWRTVVAQGVHPIHQRSRRPAQLGQILAQRLGQHRRVLFDTRKIICVSHVASIHVTM
ncbi:hypothetical protein D3C71_1531470 [compost metagenome]